MLRSDQPLYMLFHQLRRRNFPLGPDDLLALRAVLGEGFGWGSRGALRDLCRALWAKSRDEQTILDSLFELLVKDEWTLRPRDLAEGIAPESQSGAAPAGREGAAKNAPSSEWTQPEKTLAPEVIVPPGRLPPVRVNEEHLASRPFVLVPQFPLGFREAAQIWRRLRRPQRFGPRTELDTDATIARRLELGVPAPPVLVPRRRNTARVLLLVDRDGSMAPFHDFVETVCRAIRQTAQLAESTIYYFHDLPSEGSNDSAIARVGQNSLFPTVDGVLAEIRPATHGWLYRDPGLREPLPLSEVMSKHGGPHAAVVISDAGAARGQYDVARVIDSIGFTATVRKFGMTCAWMNPLPRDRWSSTTAGEIARHVPMFSLDREGARLAVNHLRGYALSTERPGVK